jgi:hypothetical protein
MNGIDYSFVRDPCGKGGSAAAPGPCTTAGLPKDTNDNAADFIFVDTDGTSAGAVRRLGAPGPENLASPIQRNALFSLLNQVTVRGTTLEQPPSQPNGGGLNSSLSADTVTLEIPLPSGGSLNLRFVLGVRRSGAFRFFVNVEALTGEPEGGIEKPRRPPSRTARALRPLK